MASENKAPVTHEGVVKSVDEYAVTVEILNKPACAGCHAKGACPASGENVRDIEVPLTISSLSAGYAPGDKVLVTLSSSLSFKAVLLAYGLPLLLLLVAMLTASAFRLSELYVGLAGIGVVIFYYIALAFFKNKLAREFRFSIQKL